MLDDDRLASHDLPLSSEQAAPLIGVKTKTLHAWRQRRPPIGPRFILISGRCVRYLRADITAWLNSRRVETEQVDGDRRS
jgi:predicted DNA-binding transcriptional regulator AlpA